MPFSTYTNLGLGRIGKFRGQCERYVLEGIGKIIFPIDFIILDIPEDNDVPLILKRPFLSTAHSKIDVYKRKITLRVGEEKPVFKSIKPATSIIKRDGDSFMEEIDLSFTPDDPMPPSIEEDDDDSEKDILLLEELLDNYSLSLPENESFCFDIPSFSRPPAKPPDSNTGILNIKMMGDISEQKVPMPGLMITHASNQEKSLDLLSHRSLKIFQPSAKCPMMIHGKNIHILDVPLFHFYPIDQLQYGGIGSSSAT
nr:hypothetical protein [Tanacetum cinerariifolium]